MLQIYERIIINCKKIPRKLVQLQNLTNIRFYHFYFLVSLHLVGRFQNFVHEVILTITQKISYP